MHPLGVCHVRLPLGEVDEKGDQQFEHYSWKKVTTSVNNLIVGKLWIDHFGDMVIKNHRTGEEVTVTFKPKIQGSWFGWGGGKKEEKVF